MASGPDARDATAPLGVGFLVGGRLGPAVVRRLPGEALRAVVGFAGLAVAVRLAVAAC